MKSTTSSTGLPAVHRFLAVLLLSFVPVAMAQAQVTFSGTSGNWTNTATWTGGLIPGAGTNVVVSSPGTIGVSSAVSAESLALSNATTFTLDISNTAALNVVGAITDVAAGNSRIFVANATEALATNRLTATSLTADNVFLRNFNANTNFWGANYNISTIVQFSVGESSSVGSAAFTQNGGANSFDNGSYGLAIGQAQTSTNAGLALSYNLNAGSVEALRIGAGNGDGNGTTLQRYLTASSYNFNFNAGTLQNRGSGTTLNIQNGYANDGTTTNTSGLNTSAPLLLRLSASGSNVFNANGASSLIIVSPSARVVDQTGVAGTITKTGVGDLVFAGGNSANSNTWTGATTVSNGGVVVDYNRIAGQAATGGTDSLANAYSAASQLVLAGGNFTLTGRGSAAASNLTGLTLSTTSLTYTVGSTTGLVVGQAVTNANLPAGTYIRRIISSTQFELNNFATNAASGQTLNLGAASFANTQVISNVLLQSNATVTVNPGAGTSTTLLTFSNFSGAGSLNKAGTGTLALAPGSGVTNTLTGNLTGSAGTIAKSGAGRVILGTTNSAGNTFSGAIAVNEGVLQIGNSTNSNDSTQRLTSAASASVASGATLLFKNSSALPTGASLSVAGLIATDVSGVVGGGFYNVLGPLTLSNGGEVRANQGASAGAFQSYALNGTVTVTGTSASSITTQSSAVAGDGIHLANNAALNRTFNVADVTGNTNVDLTVSARLINAANGGQAAGITKDGAGLMRLSGSNSFTGSVVVNNGTLELATAAGAAAGAATSATVGSGATLLISTSNQVNDSATVTLSGGTIRRGSGVSEAFSNLNVTTASTINFGGTAESSFLQFGTVTGGVNLTISNFLLNNEFRFAAANFAAGETIANSFTFLTSDARTYSFGSGTFTITAIPEPSAIVAALGLIGLGLWPLARKRFGGKSEARRL